MISQPADPHSQGFIVFYFMYLLARFVGIRKLKRAHKGVMVNVKLDIIKHFNHGKQNKDIMHALNSGSGNAKKKFPYKLMIIAKHFVGTLFF